MLLIGLVTVLVASSTICSAYGPNSKFMGPSSLSNSLLGDIMTWYSNPDGDQSLQAGDQFEQNELKNPGNQMFRVAKDISGHFQPRMDDILLAAEPSIRDQEYLEHSSLFGHQYVQGGAGEGHQRLKPDGSVKNIQVIKTDAALPAYCNPPNPCPVGYTAEDGCIEEFVNSAAFSREYQAAQECMCDTEHMFDCPGSSGNEDTELDTLARTLSNREFDGATLDQLAESFAETGRTETADHKVVAKKFFTKKNTGSTLYRMRRTVATKNLKAKRSVKNPYLEGERLPVVAKKSPQTSGSM